MYQDSQWQMSRAVTHFQKACEIFLNNRIFRDILEIFLENRRIFAKVVGDSKRVIYPAANVIDFN